MILCDFFGLDRKLSKRLPPPPIRSHLAAALTLALAGAACSSVPGESAATGSVQRQVRERVLSLSRAADPQCRQHKVITTEMLDVHSDGRPSEELWTVDQCGKRVNYLVTFPPKRATGFSVRPEP